MMSSDHMTTIFCASFLIPLIINIFNTFVLKTTEGVLLWHSQSTPLCSGYACETEKMLQLYTFKL